MKGRGKAALPGRGDPPSRGPVPGWGRTPGGKIAACALLILLASPSVGSGPTEVEREAGRRDALGFLLPPGQAPQRIISLSPSITEMLFALGVRANRIAGVTRFCDYPAEARMLRRVGGIVDPSIEAILAIRPDLVLGTRGNPTAVLEKLRAAGAHVYAFESEGGLEQILETMKEMREIVVPDDTLKAGRVIAAFSADMARLRDASRLVPVSERARVYYYDPVSPEWTAGPKTHIDEAIMLAGGINVAGDARIAWPRMATEVLLERQPDLLLVAAPGNDTTAAARAEILRALKENPGWRGLRAVREGYLCLVPADWLMRPGPRVIGAIEALAGYLRRTSVAGHSGRTAGERK